MSKKASHITGHRFFYTQTQILISPMFRLNHFVTAPVDKFIVVNFIDERAIISTFRWSLYLVRVFVLWLEYNSLCVASGH